VRAQTLLSDTEINYECPCCGTPARICIGYFHTQDGERIGAYAARWADAHLDGGFIALISIGSWATDSSDEQRRAFGFEGYADAEGINVQVVDASEAMMGESDNTGRKLSVKEAENDPEYDSVLDLLGMVFDDDNRINQFLQRCRGEGSE
jgi:hypothetical protein